MLNRHAIPNPEFADWLNLIDATIGYDKRRQIGLDRWLHLFRFGSTPFEAVQAMFAPDQLAKDWNSFPRTGKAAEMWGK